MKLAVLCYIISNGKVLMLYRNKKEQDYHEGKWNGLGGKFEKGESPEACLKREILEESGLTLLSYDYKGMITFPNFDGKDDWYIFLYTSSEFTGTLIDSPEGHLEWIPLENLKELNLWEGDRIFMDWVFQSSQKFSAIFRYEEGCYKDYEVQFYY